MPTMRELAAALDTSVTTVSMALRNHPKVALETRRLVQKFAREQGYQLNPALTSLMSRVRYSERAQYQETIGWLNLWETEDHFTKAGVEYARKLWQGAQQRATKLGYILDPFWLAESGMSSARMKSILAARGIRGLLIPPLPRSCGHLSIDWKEFSAVALSHTLARPELHRVVPDHYQNMQLIVRKIRKRGYRRPGLLLPRRYDERSEHRVSSAFQYYQSGFPDRCKVPPLICAEEGYEKPVRQWLGRYRPDVVITVGKLRNLPLPATLECPAVVLISRASTDPGVAGINENPAIIGATAVDQLGAQLSRNERGLSSSPLTILIKGTWVDGKSLPTYR